MAVPASLITIPLSHYCEKARWALDRVAFPYREEPHAPLFHRLATKRRDGGTVPVMVAATSRFVDSTEILAHADVISGGGLLYPCDEVLRREVDVLEERFDTELGPHTRRWAHERSLERVRSVFRQVDQQLSDGRKFLTGDRFTAADLTFAALAAPVLLPVECRAVQPTLETVPAAMREEILRFRNTDAGRFALRLFSQERGRTRNRQASGDSQSPVQ